MASSVNEREIEPKLAFKSHASYAGLPVAAVHRTPLLTPAECARIVELARGIGMTRASQSRDPGLNKVLRLPVNGTGGSAQLEALRLELLEFAFAVHGRACALAHSLYGDQVAIAAAPVWKKMPRASVHDKLIANLTEWNKHVKFNMNVLQYTTRGGHVGTTLHRDESPLAFVVTLFRSSGVATGGGTEYAFLPASSRRVTVTPPTGTMVLHPGDVAHRGVPIEAHPGQVGERWIIAGFLGTARPLPPLKPEPPLAREGDVMALAARWRVAPMGCHVDPKDFVPRYKKRNGNVSPLRLGKRQTSVYTNTQSANTGRDYRYYVTTRCRKQGSLNDVIQQLHNNM